MARGGSCRSGWARVRASTQAFGATMRVGPREIRNAPDGWAHDWDQQGQGENPSQ